MDCKVGYIGPEKTTSKTKSRKCFDAIRSNGACADCERRFQDGTAYRTVHLHVHDPDKGKVEAALKGVTGISKAQFPGRDRVDF